MMTSDNLAGRLDHAAISAVEAVVLSNRIGDLFNATVISAQEGTGVIQLTWPVVTAPWEGDLRPGERTQATLVSANIAAGIVNFEPAAKMSA